MPRIWQFVAAGTATPLEIILGQAAPDHDAVLPFEMLRRKPAAALAGVVADICAYRETMAFEADQREAAGLVVPLVVSIGSPFEIALGREPASADRQPSFTAGLFAGPVHIRSDGRAHCVQANLTPLGAFRLFGGAIGALTARMIDIEDVFGADGRRLREAIGNANAPERQIDLLESFIVTRIKHTPSAEIGFAYGELARTRGTMRIGVLAGTIGWSRKHLANRFAAEIGLAPKTIARMMRFHTACRQAMDDKGGGWAAIAFDAGYADQAHLVREFVEMAGETPQAWARRIMGMDSRLTFAPEI